MTQNIDDIIKEVKAKLSNRDTNHNPFLKEIPWYVANFVSRGIGIKVTSFEGLLRISAVFPSGIESKIVDYSPENTLSNFVNVTSPPDPYDMLVEAIWRGHEVTQRDRYLFQFAKHLMDLMTDEGIMVNVPNHGKVTLVGREDVDLFREYFTQVNETDYLKRN